MNKSRKVALIVFYDKEGKILLQDREGISKQGEKWGYFGGGIEEGETPEEAVVRETKEELEYDLIDYKFVGKVSSSDSRGVIERYVFISKLPSLKEFNQKEGTNMEVLTLEEVKEKKKVFGDNKVVEKLREIGWPPE